MNPLKPTKLEEIIIFLLLQGEKRTTTLLEEVRRIRKKTTKQGFYLALRGLKKEEVILIFKKTVSLDTVWIRKMREMLEKISSDQQTKESSSYLLNLENKESIIYSFSTIKNLDTFWGHVQSILVHNTDTKEPIFSYDPHYWFYITRTEREKELLKEMIANKKQFLMTVGGTTPLDKVVKDAFNNYYLQYNYNRMFDKPNYYITLVGDYIIEVTLDSAVSKKIDDIYQKSVKITDEIILDLKTLLEVRSKNKLKISKNKEKTIKMKRRFKKDFYILR